MDVNAALDELRAIINRRDPEEYERALELVEAIDQWLSKGGFLPNAWNRPENGSPERR